MLSLIVAYDTNRGIGKSNQMPWHYSEDLQYFRKVTANHTVAMGRNTFLSIGKALPKRKNIVFTSNKASLQDAINIEIHEHPQAFFEQAQHTEEEIFVIGGSKIYQLALPYATKLYITHIHKAYDVDTYFPEVDFTQFKKITEEVSGELTFSVYQKVNTL
jgi:Dihydrofolate reductase